MTIEQTLTRTKAEDREREPEEVRGPSKSQIDKAGKTLRYFMTGRNVSLEAVSRSVDVLGAYRAMHQQPLTTANMGLRSVVRTVGCVDPEITQRLKRIPTILEKLRRQPSMALTTMQDIGGCRAVLNDLDEVRRVRDRIVGRRAVIDEKDYVVNPKEDGYRGLHLVVDYHSRKIEIQLRTRIMHAWAVTIEQLAHVVGTDLKSGEGPKPVRDLMQAISQAMAVEERGSVVDTPLIEKIAQLRVEAAPHLASGRR